MSTKSIDPVRLAKFGAVVDRLPELPRTVYLLHVRDEEELSAIAQRLGLTLNEVIDHLAHALVALVTALDEADP
jgi:DNA-directed RNA polymerase specialized sigma24 family protein